MSSSASKPKGSGFRSPFERDGQLLALIGTVVTRWAAVDTLLVELVAGHTSCSHEEAERLIFDNGAGERRMKAIIKKLKEADDTEDRAQAIELVKRLMGLLADRNVIVHGTPIEGGSRTPITRSWDFYIRNMRRGHDPARPDWKQAHDFVQQHADAIALVESDLFQFANRWGIAVLNEHNAKMTQQRAQNEDRAD